MSLTISVEVCHSAATRRNYNANIVSTTQEEAADKLKNAVMLWASIDPKLESLGFKPIKYQDSQETLAFHMPPNTSTITSKPGTSAIRGGKKDMYYDEAAFIDKFPQLFQAGLPAITRGEGKISVISTPFGETGLYHDLWQEPKWSHHLIPWWESRFMVANAEGTEDPYAAVAEASFYAPDMSTEERIERFGSEKLKDIYHVGLREDLIAFQTEYECMFVDEAESYFPWDLILSNKDEELPKWKYWPEGFRSKGFVSIGVDLAKMRDSTVFTVVDHYTVDDVQKKRVLYVYATQADYSDQFEELKLLVRKTNATRVSIDATGPGAMFAERANREGFGVICMVEPITFTNPIKEEWATKFKGDLQEGLVSYPAIAELLEQIHGVKRTKTLNNNFRFAGEKDDYFWSLMLALYGAGVRPVRFSLIG